MPSHGRSVKPRGRSTSLLGFVMGALARISDCQSRVQNFRDGLLDVLGWNSDAPLAFRRDWDHPAEILSVGSDDAQSS